MIETKDILANVIGRRTDKFFNQFSDPSKVNNYSCLVQPLIFLKKAAAKLGFEIYYTSAGKLETT